MFRYIRAFFVALKLTLQGEQISLMNQTDHPALAHWAETSGQLVRKVLKTCETGGFPLEARKAITVQADGRTLTMETILQAVHYHATQEYPHLLKHGGDHGLTAIYASNLNDQYYVLRLSETLKADAVLMHEIQTLLHHLEAIPAQE